jgi:hypothetical protein
MKRGGAIMDIFTTALTRVVPVPIKPTNLKVKALEKDAAASGVSDDIQGLEDHDLYFKKQVEEKSEQEQEEQKQQQVEIIADEIILPSSVPSDNTGQNIDLFDDGEEDKMDKDDKPHLDIFV